MLYVDDEYDLLMGNMNLINNAIVHVIEEIPGMQVIPQRNQPTRNTNYYEVTIPMYSLDEFREHFRMGRDVMEVLLQAVAHNIHEMRVPLVPLEKKLLLTIWLLAKPETFLACGDRFGVSRGTAHYIFREIVGVISQMVNQYITWPTPHECERNAEEFFEKSHGIPNVIGAIDGTHIFIKQPFGNPFDFYNRYQSHSVVIQGVCDPRKRFIHISVGHPGRMHDARIFRRSNLYTAITNNENPLIRPEQHIIGDCAYPLLQEVLTPFRNTGHLTPGQLRYNTRFSTIRSVIERAFALLKGKWRRLKFLDMSDMNLLHEVLTACCVIHNMILEAMDEDEEDVIQEEDIDDIPAIELRERRRHILGEMKRNEIVNILHD